MLSKCANPLCFDRFRYLRVGRIFNVEIRPASDASPLNHRIEHFWLCESCAKILKVVWENGAVNVRPLYLALTAGTTQEKAGRERNAA